MVANPPPPRRILVTGSRDWSDEFAIILELAAIERGREGVADRPTLVHGACPTGADAIAAMIAGEYGWTVEGYPADWSAHGRAAGPLRNRKMVELGADLCFAFIGACTSPRCRVPGRHDSHGATGCADLADAAGIPTVRIRDDFAAAP